MRKHSVVVGLAAVSAVALALTGCTGQAEAGKDSADKSLLIWTVEDVAERVAIEQQIVDEYSKETGVKVELVALAEDQLSTVLASSAAAGKLPDVVGAVSLPGINQMQSDGLLDSAAAEEIVKSLDPSTFSEAALSLTQADGEQIAVPSDGWAQLLYYRTDLFEKLGLEAPTTYDAIETAAAALEESGVAGIVASTTPADSFTQQTFEHFALANGCELVDKSGDIALGSKECEHSIEFYGDLMKNYSVAGAQDADTTRATYFAGEAGMVVWSSFLLDELAGLRNDALPTCAECAADPAFLAANTGVVSALEGPDAKGPSSFGEIVSWAVLKDASPAAQDFVSYMMSKGYTDWLGIAPEGKVPTRLGTPENPSEYTDAWQQLEAGVDTKALLSSVYGAEILDAVAQSPGDFSRWGIPTGHGALSAAVSGQFVLPQALATVIDGGGNAKDAAKQAVEQAKVIQSDLE
jgi:multiple sugar transport system substrate-binding protein